MSVTIPVNDANWFWSPYNWYINGSTYAQSSLPGAYFKMTFNGTTPVLLFDWSVQTGASLGAGSYPWFEYSIDNQKAQYAQLTSAGTLAITGGLVRDVHNLIGRFVWADRSIDQWTTPVSAIRITGFQLDNGGFLQANAGVSTPYGKNAMVLGDSITRGAITIDAATDDFRLSYVEALMDALKMDYGVVSYGSWGWTTLGQTNVPTLPNAWDKHFTGQTRLVAGLLSPPPDVIINNAGANDGIQSISDAAVQAACQTWLTAARAAAPLSQIVLLIPFGGYKLTAIQAAVVAQADANVALINLSGESTRGLTGPQGPATYQAPVDGIHPSGPTNARLAAMSSRAILNLGKAGTTEFVVSGMAEI